MLAITIKIVNEFKKEIVIYSKLI